MGLRASLAATLLTCNTMLANVRATIANTTISQEVIYEEMIPPDDFFRIYRCRETSDPEALDDFSGRYFEDYYSTTLCSFNDPVVFRVQGVQNDINAKKNIILTNTIKCVDPADYVADVTNFGTGLASADLQELEQFSTDIIVDGDSGLTVFRNTDDDYTLVQNPNSDTVLRLEDGVAQINNFDVELKTITNINQNNYFTTYYNPDGTVSKISIVELLQDAGTGTRTWTLPITLPDALPDRVNIQLQGVAVASQISAAKYIEGSLTTSQLQFDVFDGSTFGDDDVYAELTWYNKVVL